MKPSKRNKRVLVTGASGTVGRQVVRQLLQKQKTEVVVFDLETNTSRKFFKQFQGRLKVVYGDISHEQEVAVACRELDAVIHLAAIIPPVADTNPELAKQVNVTGTLNLINAVNRYSPEAFFLYSSSVSVYGDRLENPWITVNDPLKPCKRDYYAKTKIEAENMVREKLKNWAIFRLTAIMGVGNHGISPLMFHMPLETKLEICTPDDTARAFVLALEYQNKLNHKVFNLGGGPSCRLTYREFITRSFAVSGLGKPDFKPGTFAEKNFHCGYYADGDELEEILHFRRQSVADYFEALRQSVSPLRKTVTRILRPFIFRRLQKASEPYQAIKKGISADLEYYFKQKTTKNS